MTIKKKLDAVISSMSDFSKQTNMVAINASIHAGRLNTREGAPFQVIAREIQEMSARSITKLEELDALMKEIGAMSRLINLSGRQRMILMKILNAKLLSDHQNMIDSKAVFEESLAAINCSSLNTPESTLVLSAINELWQPVKDQLTSLSPVELSQCFNGIIASINELIAVYEDSSGQ